jgi:hypothetical protein
VTSVGESFEEDDGFLYELLLSVLDGGWVDGGIDGLLARVGERFGGVDHEDGKLEDDFRVVCLLGVRSEERRMLLDGGD